MITDVLCYPLVCRVLRPRNLVKKISNLAKKITGSVKCSSLTGNKLQGFQIETCYHQFLGCSDRLRDSQYTGAQVVLLSCGTKQKQKNGLR